MPVLIASPTARRREERILTRARMDRIDSQLDRLVEVVTPTPAFTDEDVAEVGKLLVEGRIKLPSHTRLTVITEVEDVRHKLFNTSTQLIKHEADQLHTRLLRPMTVLEALDKGLIRHIPNGWVWSEVAYERLARTP
jgi:hypothetical protein